MNPCEECLIHDKIYECCGRFPDTGETVLLAIGGNTTVIACPYFDRHGRCTIYESRPLRCRSHYCYQYSLMESGSWNQSDIITYQKIITEND